MSKFVRFARVFEHKAQGGTRTRYPSGWSGEVVEEVAKAAEQAKALIAGREGAASTTPESASPFAASPVADSRAPLNPGVSEDVAKAKAKS